MRRRRVVVGLVALGIGPLIGGCRTSARARLPLVGYLSGNKATPVTHPAFLDGLRNLGYVEGQNLRVEYRGPSTKPDELRAMAADLVARSADVIVAAGGTAQLAAMAATATTPIVLAVGPDPVKKHWVTSYERPGGNVTGPAIDFDAEARKKLQLLKEAVPATRRVALLYRSDNTGRDSIATARDAATALGLDTGEFGASDLGEMRVALAHIDAGRFDAMSATSVLSAIEGDEQLLPEFASRRRMASIFADRELVVAGGLMYYGANYDAHQRRAAVYVDKVLRGESPAELPIELLPDREFVVNLAAARRLGLEIPDRTLQAASAVLR